MTDDKGMKGSVGEPWVLGNGYSKRWEPMSNGVPKISAEDADEKLRPESEWEDPLRLGWTDSSMAFSLAKR